MKNMSFDSLKRSLGMIAYMVGRQFGVTVQFQNTATASTNGETITIPAIKVDTREAWQTVEGYIYHETAHIRYTDFSVLRQNLPDQVLHFLWNAIEDTWVEIALEKERPGLVRVFKRLIQLVYSSDSSEVANGVAGILNFVLLTLRVEVRDHDFLSSRLEKHREAIADAHGIDFVDIVTGMCKTAGDCNSTQEAFHLASEIYDFLKKESQKNPPESQADQNSSSESSSENSGQQAGEQSGSDPVQNSSSENSTGGSSEIAQESPTTTGQEGQGTGGQGGTGQPLDWDALVKESEELAGVGEKIQEWLETQSLDDLPPVVLPEVIEGYEIQISSSEITMAARKMISIREAVLADVFRHSQAGYAGRKLMSRRLPGMVAKTDYKVFTSPQMQRELDTHIHLLVDISVSMDSVSDPAAVISGQIVKSRMDEANSVMLGLKKCLHGVPGISLEITAFGSVGGKPIVIPHSGKMDMGFITRGNTPLAEALDWVLFNDSLAHEQRKIVFIITDGTPQNVNCVKANIAKLNSYGIQTIGIVIGNEGIPELFNTSVVIKSAAELASALNSIWVNLLYG